MLCYVCFAMHCVLVCRIVVLTSKGWGVPFGTAVVSDLPQRQMDIAAQVVIYTYHMSLIIASDYA
jgi:hypothetical protein